MVLLIVTIFCGLFSEAALSIQYSMQSDVASQIGYNDNIFVTTLPHSSVSIFSIVPSIKLDIKDRGWDAYLNGKIRNNNYSDHNLDGNDLFLDASGNYTQERNMYMLSGAYNKSSNLSIEPTDFGVTGYRVSRKLRSITPQYRRLLTEKLIFSASYERTNVNYIDSTAASSVPYSTDTFTTSIQYGLSERDKLSLMMQKNNYVSRDDAFKYKLSVLRGGYEHNFTETLSIKLSIGASHRNSSSTVSVPLVFFGQPITYPQVSDYTDSGKVFDINLNKSFQKGALATTISRNDVASSYGGLSEVNILALKFDHHITSLWRYTASAQYEKTKSVTSALNASNNKTMNFMQRLSYTFDRQWNAYATYRYLKREFTSTVITDKMPSSNAIYVGLTYNFSDISTY